MITEIFTASGADHNSMQQSRLYFQPFQFIIFFQKDRLYFCNFLYLYLFKSTVEPSVLLSPAPFNVSVGGPRRRQEDGELGKIELLCHSCPFCICVFLYLYFYLSLYLWAPEMEMMRIFVFACVFLILHCLISI